ncbi:MAG TPA: hypothetical protein VGC74_01125 [Stenotrophomonas sp.]
MKPITLYLDSVRWHANDAQGLPLDGPRGESTDVPLADHAAWLESLGARRRSITVLLSAACVPSLCLPWSASVPLARELRHRVGDAWSMRRVNASTHDIHIHWPDYGMPIVSLAYPRTMLRGLAEQLAPHRPGSVACGVFAAAERHLAKTRAARELLMFNERDGYSALHIQAGQLIDAEYLRSDGRGLDAFPVWFKRKAMEYPDAGQVRWLAGEESAPLALCEGLE